MANKRNEYLYYQNILLFGNYRNAKLLSPKLDEETFYSELGNHNFVKIPFVQENGSLLLLIFMDLNIKKNKTEDLNNFIKITNNVIKEYETSLNLEIQSSLILVYPHNLPFQNKKISEIRKNNPNINVDIIPNYIFVLDVTKCPNNGKFNILSKEELLNIKKKTRIDFNCLPKIYTSDPQIIWIGAKAGDIVEIRFSDAISPLNTEFRKVTRPPNFIYDESNYSTKEEESSGIKLAIDEDI